MDLDFFVMFSSMASIVGNMGQSSYSACNAFQDSLAQYRSHVLGLPGLAINWGPISGAGVMERETGIVKLMTKVGLGFIHAKEGKMYTIKMHLPRLFMHRQLLSSRLELLIIIQNVKAVIITFIIQLHFAEYK